MDIESRPSFSARDESRGARDGRRELGRRGEQLAGRHLRRLGFSVLARNVRTRHGEIDLIVFDGESLVFVEVKALRATARSARASGELSDPLRNLRPAQRMRLRRLAAAWLADAGAARPTAGEIRFDAIGVTVDEHDRLLALEHLEAAW